MSAHTRKKQFTPSSNQPSITNFFNRSSFRSDTSGPDTHQPLRPELPQSIQSSLINVGMRVRKSVPEGYKTHKTSMVDENNDEYDFPTRRTAQSASQGGDAYTTSHAHFGQQQQVGAFPSSAPPVPYIRSGNRELQPFCGLHAVGGIPSASTAGGTPSLSAVPSLVSQGSYGSVSAPRDGLKRSYSEDIEAEIDDAFDDEVDGVRVGRKMQERVYATPMGRMKGCATLSAGVVDGDFMDTDVGFLQ